MFIGDFVRRETDFNPRSPCGERRTGQRQRAGRTLNFNPRSPCGERPRVRGGDGYLPRISIHALLAESDFCASVQYRESSYFNPRSPCGERQVARPAEGGLTYFNPRSPCGERPVLGVNGLLIMLNFNPRSPCGERQQIPPNWPYRFCLKCQFKDGEKSKKAKGSASAQASSPAYEKNKVRIPWGDFECFRFAPIK